MSMKRTILIKEVKYSNQANTLLGMEKMTHVVTTNMVTAHIVSTSAVKDVHKIQNGDYSCAARYPPLGSSHSRDAALGKSPFAQN